MDQEAQPAGDAEARSRCRLSRRPSRSRFRSAGPESKCPSIAASLAGWCAADHLRGCARDQLQQGRTRATTRPMCMPAWRTSRWRSQEQIEGGDAHDEERPRHEAAGATWLSRSMLEGLKTMAQKSVMTARRAVATIS